MNPGAELGNKPQSDAYRRQTIKKFNTTFQAHVKLPEQYPLQLEAEPLAAPCDCSCHPQSRASHVLLFPKHIPAETAKQMIVPKHIQARVRAVNIWKMVSSN